MVQSEVLLKEGKGVVSQKSGYRLVELDLFRFFAERVVREYLYNNFEKVFVREAAQVGVLLAIDRDGDDIRVEADFMRSAYETMMLLLKKDVTSNTSVDLTSCAIDYLMDLKSKNKLGVEYDGDEEIERSRRSFLRKIKFYYEKIGVFLARRRRCEEVRNYVYYFCNSFSVRFDENGNVISSDLEDFPSV